MTVSTLACDPAKDPNKQDDDRADDAKQACDFAAEMEFCVELQRQSGPQGR